MEGTRYISELLEQHDCVIIPGLGGFVGSYHPAAIHPLYHTFQPPYKKLLFNISLRQNDGLLADHIARTERIPFAEANEKVKKYSEECLLRLKANRQVQIRDVGRLFMGLEGTVQFDQDPRRNLLAESYGFQPFFSVPVKIQAAAPQQIPITEPVLPRRMAKRALARPLKWAAVLALPVGLAILMSISGYDHFRTSGLTYADILSSISTRLSPFSSAEKKAEPVPLKQPVVKQGPEPVVEKPAPVATSEPASVAAPAPELPFAVIIGAFRIEENATKLIAGLQNKGIPASLYDVTPGGLHRVAAGTFADRGEAIAALHQIRLKGFEGAWLLVK
jgi:cell division septation protein DedD